MKDSPNLVSVFFSIFFEFLCNNLALGIIFIISIVVLIISIVMLIRTPKENERSRAIYKFLFGISLVALVLYVLGVIFCIWVAFIVASM